MFAFYPLNYIAQFGVDQLGIYTIQNYLELSVFVVITYKILTWLKTDHTKSLLIYSYMYCFALWLSYISSCNILFHSMIILLPVLLLFSIIIHQKHLQKNFILSPSARLITPQSIPNKNWHEILVRSILLSSYQHKEIICIIQRSQDLKALLLAPYDLYLPIQQDILDFILASNNLDNHTMLWVDQAGTLCSVNVKWQKSLTEELFPSNHINENFELAKILTNKTDAFAFVINAFTQEHAIWYQGTYVQKLSVDQLLKSCKQILYQPSTLSNNALHIDNLKGKNHAQKNDTAHTPPSFH